MMERFVMVEMDLHEQFGIDLGDREMLSRRSWRWLRLRIWALLSVDRGPFGDGGSRLQRELRPVNASASGPKVPDTN